MTRNPDLPCSVCGRLLWRRTGSSLPEGKATCRPCRRLLVRHGTSDAYKRKGCRCLVCRTAHNERMREYKTRRAAADDSDGHNRPARQFYRSPM